MFSNRWQMSHILWDWRDNMGYSHVCALFIRLSLNIPYSPLIDLYVTASLFFYCLCLLLFSSSLFSAQCMPWLCCGWLCLLFSFLFAFSTAAVRLPSHSVNRCRPAPVAVHYCIQWVGTHRAIHTVHILNTRVYTVYCHTVYLYCRHVRHYYWCVTIKYCMSDGYLFTPSCCLVIIITITVWITTIPVLPGSAVFLSLSPLLFAAMRVQTGVLKSNKHNLETHYEYGGVQTHETKQCNIDVVIADVEIVSERGE